jgi:hypothetical protein
MHAVGRIYVSGQPLPNPEFDALRSGLYHGERRGFYSTVNRLLSLGVIVFGAGAVGREADLIHVPGGVLEMAAMLCASIQVVFDFCGHAHHHGYLQKRYFDKLGEIRANPSPDPAALARWCAELAALCGEETGQMRALDAICYNQALDALYADEDWRRKYRKKVTWCQRRLRHLVPFHDADFGAPPNSGADQSKTERGRRRLTS